jgi:hypothetical protein
VHHVRLSGDAGQARAESDWDSAILGALSEHSVKPASAHNGTAAGRVTGRAIRHCAELLARAAPHDHVRSRMGIGKQLVAEAKGVQHGESIRRNVEECARIVVRVRGGFEDLNLPAVGGQKHGRSWAGDAATDDKCAWHDSSCL